MRAGERTFCLFHGYGWVRFGQRSLGMSGKEATPEPVFLVSWGPAGRRCPLCPAGLYMASVRPGDIFWDHMNGIPSQP